MVPGVVVAVWRLSCVCKRASRAGVAAVASFVPMCLASIAYHAADCRKRRLKARLLRLDYLAQQACAVAHTLAVYPSRTARTVATAAACGLAASTWPMDTGRLGRGIIATQALVIAIAMRFRVDGWWLAALAARAASASDVLDFERTKVVRIGAWAHGLFHLFVVKACADVWSSGPPFSNR